MSNWTYQSDNNYLKWPKTYFGKLYWKSNYIFFFLTSPIRLHGEGGVHVLYCSQPKGGDQRARSFTFKDMWGTPGLNLQTFVVSEQMWITIASDSTLHQCAA